MEFIAQLIGKIVFLAIMVGLIFVVALIRYRMPDASQSKPSETLSFSEYLPKFFKAYPIRLMLALLAALFLGWIAILVLATILITVKKKIRYKSVPELRREADEAETAWLAKLGPDQESRAARIEQMFEDRTGSVSATYMAEWHSFSGQEKKEGYARFTVSRSLATMDNRQREHLRIAELLNSAAEGKNKDFRLWRTTLIWGDGKGEEGATQWQGLTDAERGRSTTDAALNKIGASVDKVISALNDRVANLRASSDTPPALKAAAEEAAEHLAPGGQGWLKAERIKGTVFERQNDFALHLGRFADGQPLDYSGDGSLITIAPPGAGKTQCHVFPNLLTWKGPAVVLDISGDIYEHTSKWRAENVGPVYKFSPLEPEDSHSYNPLTFVRRHPDYVWEDSKLLAEMMIVPSNAADPFWENEARTVLTAAIAHICYSNPPEKRPMHAVLDVIYGGKAWDDMLLGLRMAVDVRAMVQHANALGDMNEKTRSSVLQTARSSLSAWAGERIARVTAHSDWSPTDLRSGQNPTIYIYIRPNEVDAYLSLLRVFIGQHIRLLTGGAVPPRGSPPILFMLDEMPRLRNMPPIDEALNIGRKYGLRLWMFAQSLGQMQEAYKNADGMVGACAVRTFMNPSGADGMAEKVSEEIGYVDSLVDGQRKRLVEAAVLTGPTFREQMVVFGVGARPARINKDPAWKDDALQARMGAVEQVVAE